MKTISFKILGKKPEPKGRPRFYRGKNYIGTYTPDNTAVWENWVRLCALSYRPKCVPGCPVEMDLVFLLPRPKSLSKKIANHIKKPDIDNFVKGFMDPLNGIFYCDDAQVFKITACKVYSTGDVGVVAVIKYYEDADVSKRKAVKN